MIAYVDRLSAIGDHLCGDRLQRVLHTVQSFEFEQVIHELACHLTRIGEQLFQLEFQLFAAVGLDQSIDECSIDFRAHSDAGDQRAAAHAIRRMMRQGDRDRAAQRMSNQVHVGQPDRVEAFEKTLNQCAERAVPHVLGRLPMSRQLECIDRPADSQRFLIEQPVIKVSAESMDQDHGRLAVAPFQITDPAVAQQDRFRRCSLRVALLYGNFGSSLFGKSVNFFVRSFGIGNHRQQAAHGNIVVGQCDVTSQDACHRGLDRTGDLFGLDLNHVGFQ